MPKVKDYGPWGLFIVLLAIYGPLGARADNSPEALVAVLISGLLLCGLGGLILVLVYAGFYRLFKKKRLENVIRKAGYVATVMITFAIAGTLPYVLS